jgi:hypothetical protein
MSRQLLQDMLLAAHMLEMRAEQGQPLDVHDTARLAVTLRDWAAAWDAEIQKARAARQPPPLTMIDGGAA